MKVAAQELSFSCGNLRPATIKTLGISSLALFVICAKFLSTSIQSPISKSVELNQVNVTFVSCHPKRKVRDDVPFHSAQFYGRLLSQNRQCRRAGLLDSVIFVNC
jgi:hypothetical protein